MGDFKAGFRTNYTNEYRRKYDAENYKNDPNSSKYKRKNEWYDAQQPERQQHMREWLLKKAIAEMSQDTRAEVQRLRATPNPPGFRERPQGSMQHSRKRGHSSLEDDVDTAPQGKKARSNQLQPNFGFNGQEGNPRKRNYQSSEADVLVDTQNKRARVDTNASQVGPSKNRGPFSSNTNPNVPPHTPGRGLGPSGGEMQAAPLFNSNSQPSSGSLPGALPAVVQQFQNQYGPQAPSGRWVFVRDGD